MRIGEQIKEVRKTRGVTQKKLGEAIDFSEAQISYVENGKRNLSSDKLKKIEKVLECKFCYTKKEFIIFETKADKLYEIMKLVFGTPNNYKEIEEIWNK
jgi:UDP-N-acetylglucosamine 1-carboxyvinyltransferase